MWSFSHNEFIRHNLQIKRTCFFFHLLEISETEQPIRGGKTWIGKLFSYQERTGLSIDKILKIPYIMLIVGMLDAPSIDFEKNKKEGVKIKTAQDEANAFLGFLK